MAVSGSVGDVETTAWTEDDNGYLSFDLNEQAQALHLLTVSDDAAALWETNTGDPQVWLAERPAWQ